MKQKFLVLFIILISLKIEAKKMNYPLTVIAASADLIIIGEIDRVKQNLYSFEIKETLKGSTRRFISVKMFNEWTCDPRWEKPKKGQKLLLFLKKKLNYWTIINGSSGELFISNNTIYLGGDDSLKIVNNKITRNHMSLIEFKTTIRDFSKCYTFIGEYGFHNNTPQYFKQISSDKQIAEYKKHSKFSFELFDTMKLYDVRK